MCEKRTRKIKKGSNLTRLREARRVQRLQRLSPPPVVEAPRPCHPVVDKAAQSRVLLQLAWKTVALMHKNKIIQQKIVALQKETSEFVASVMNNPENRQRYMDHLKMCAQKQAAPTIDNNNLALKVEPKA
ncbi:clock interacting protein circadian [Choristoneura fumiferana]|uniref:clock interacting protein circadian n=1 Tax=Choristoneura fumiferana TaxID=7141 RepID=UPI003D15589E